MAVAKIVREEPVRENPHLVALNEATRTLVLGDFATDTACRYSFIWERHGPGFRQESCKLLEAIGHALSMKIVCILGWKHDVSGPLKGRSRHLISVLEKSSWQVHAEPGIGIAVADVASSALGQSLAFAATVGCGSFVAFGDWGASDVWTRPPFRNTMEFFCWNHNLAPSKEFIESLGAYSGNVAYRVVDDQQPPTVVLLTSQPAGEALLDLVQPVPAHPG